MKRTKLEVEHQKVEASHKSLEFIAVMDAHELKIATEWLNILKRKMRTSTQGCTFKQLIWESLPKPLNIYS